MIIGNQEKILKNIISKNFKDQIDWAAANSGIRGLQFIDENHHQNFPDAILVDINISDMNVIEFLERLDKIMFLTKTSLMVFILSKNENSFQKELISRRHNVSNYFINPDSSQEISMIFNMIIKYNQNQL